MNNEALLPRRIYTGSRAFVKDARRTYEELGIDIVSSADNNSYNVKLPEDMMVVNMAHSEYLVDGAWYVYGEIIPKDEAKGFRYDTFKTMTGVSLNEL